jgi:hypothetical protein
MGLLRPLVCGRFLPHPFPFRLSFTNSCVFKRTQLKPSLPWRSLLLNRANSMNKSRSLEASSSLHLLKQFPLYYVKWKFITEFTIVDKNPVYNHPSYFCKARLISSSYLRLGSHALLVSLSCSDRPDNTERSSCRVPEQRNMATQHSWACFPTPWLRYCSQ